jgi:hypothetical protein
MNETTIRFSELVSAKLRKAAVLKDDVVFSTMYEGKASAGAVKIPVRDKETSAVDYDKASGASPEANATVYQTLIINRDKAVNEIIDGYDAAAVPDDLIADRLDSAGYSLAFAIDNDGANVLVSEGSKDVAEMVNIDSVYPMIIDIRTKLSKANVPDDGRRYLLVTPDFYAMLLKDSDHFITASALGDEVRQTGAIGKIAGFNVYEWNDTTANLQFIAGHPSYAVRAEEFSVPVKLVNLDGDARFIGASAVKGRIVYAHKVLKPEAVRCVFAPDVLTLTKTVAGEDEYTVNITGAENYEGCEFIYRLNPAARVKFGETVTDGESFTPGTTEIIAFPGDIAEIIAEGENGCEAVGYITL